MQGNLTPIIDWYNNKTYQCPQCHHDTVASPSRWDVYTCCNCATRFARFPRLQRFLRHVGVTCEFCTERHPVLVDGEPFGFLRRRHNGIGMYTEHQFEAWLYATDGSADHRGGVRYLNSRASRAEAVADLAWRRSMFGPIEDDPSPVLAVVADERFYKYGPDVTEEQRDAFLDGTLEAYGIGVLRAFAPPHPRRGQFHADTATWGLIAPSGLEGIYTRAAPKSLTAYAPQL
ncbi:hypothetical protein [Streptomyces griseorubiginosus]|uniref:hypothetical protein n=1 Tax=Streptomyces griseorubiginosus TaxID=67304 RepID=UPI0033F73794